VEIIEVKLEDQKGSDDKKHKYNNLTPLRHVKEKFTQNLFDDSIYATDSEYHFLEELDPIVEAHNKDISCIHRNLPTIGGICFAYEDSESGKIKKSYPDFIIETKRGLKIICELKLGEYDIDSSKTESISNGYKNNTKEFKELSKYCLGIFKNKNNKFCIDCF
jgi:hypothetical protein